MNPELSLLSDVWAVISPYLPDSEKVEIAEDIIRLFDETLELTVTDHAVHEFHDELEEAARNYFDLDEEDWDE